MKAIIGGKIILKDRIAEGCALLYTDVIEGIVPADNLPTAVKLLMQRVAMWLPVLLICTFTAISAKMYAMEKKRVSG